ncbi:hypothetical protein ACFQQB_47990 [Nonomuraea rubra]|uniref:hypothetical protein n=1 Tax=Nonomuraea rubra TaxID=46180 RepID=UPI0036209382
MGSEKGNEKPEAGRRELWGWVAATALGCLLVLVAAGQVWARVLQGTEVAAPTGATSAPR